MNTGTWRLQRLRNNQLIHFLESGVILIKDSDSGFESKLNPIKSLITLDFKFLIPKVNLYLNLKYTEKPLPRFNSAPPHLWKGVRIDIEGRWLESGKQKKKTIHHPFRHRNLQQGVDIVFVVGDYWGVVNEQVDALKRIRIIESWRTY